MGEDDDRRRVRFVLDIVGEPGELVGPEPSKAAGLEVDHVDEANEVNAVIVEAVPTRALGALAVTGEIGLAQALVDDVMLAGNVVNVDEGAINGMLSSLDPHSYYLNPSGLREMDVLPNTPSRTQ